MTVTVRNKESGNIFCVKNVEYIKFNKILFELKQDFKKEPYTYDLKYYEVLEINKE